MSQASKRQTALWAALMAGVFAAVLTISMLPRRHVPHGAPPERMPGPPGDTGPAAPQATAANPWGRFSSTRNFSVRAEDVARLEGAMLLAKGPDNEGVTGADGRPATVSFVWCADDGCVEEEKEDGALAGASGDHLAEFDMAVPATGTYYPWARVWWEDSCGNSIVVRWGRDGELKGTSVVQDGTLESWHWLPVAGPQGVGLDEGTYRLAVVNREDGARLSRVFFSGKSYEHYKPETPEG